MNYNDINDIYTYMKDNVYPYVKTVWKDVSTEEILIDRYLAVIDDNTKYKLLAIPYLINPRLFYERFKDNCIIFYNTPDPGDGLLLTIHQITPTLHIHSRFFCWVEQSTVHSYLACLVFHREHQDALQFIHNNYDLRRIGNTEERTSTGFSSFFTKTPGPTLPKNIIEK